MQHRKPTIKNNAKKNKKMNNDEKTEKNKEKTRSSCLIIFHGFFYSLFHNISLVFFHSFS